MELSAYLTFVLLAAAQVAAPGPSTLLLVSNAISHGRSQALVALSGDLTAIAFLATLSAFGVASLLTAYPSVLLALQLAGAAYMLWLGWTYLRSPRPPSVTDETALTQTSRSNLWLRSFAIGISNPKAILFFAALFPQFVPPGGSSSTVTLLVATFVLVKLVVLGAFALGAHHATRFLQTPTHARIGRLLTGLVFTVFALLIIGSALG